jgi:hypothetical protein
VPIDWRIICYKADRFVMPRVTMQEYACWT